MEKKFLAVSVCLWLVGCFWAFNTVKGYEAEINESWKTPFAVDTAKVLPDTTGAPRYLVGGQFLTQYQIITYGHTVCK